jgi:hypothetical protein
MTYANNVTATVTRGEIDIDSLEAGTEKGKTENAVQGADPNSQARDVALSDFTARVLDLITRTAKRPPQRFSATAVPVDDLAKLGKFLTDVANFKRSDVVKPTPVMAPHDDGTGSAEQLAEDVGTDDDLEARVGALLQR